MLLAVDFLIELSFKKLLADQLPSYPSGHVARIVFLSVVAGARSYSAASHARARYRADDPHARIDRRASAHGGRLVASGSAQRLDLPSCSVAAAKPRAPGAESDERPRAGSERKLSERARGWALIVGGPDGCGKTTLAGALVETLEAIGPVLHFHQRASVLPRRTNVPITDPYRRSPYGRAVSTLKLIYLYADWLLGWATRVEPFLRGGGSVVIERGWWDIAVDPRRYRVRPSARFASWLCRCVPPPDRIFVLDAPAEVIAARKPELPVTEIARQSAAWRELLSGDPGAVWLDASASPDDVRSRAAQSLGLGNDVRGHVVG